MSTNTDPLVLTQYYFDTFIVGAHHSIPHLIIDLIRRKDAALSIPTEYNKKLIDLIDAKLSELNLNEIEDLELCEKVYWVNELGKRSAVEISTYGRIRPETMSMLICLEDEDFTAAMSIAARLSQKIQNLAEMQPLTPIPAAMPIMS